MQIEARNLEMLWKRVERQFTAEGFDRQLAERSYDWFEAAVEQFMVDATEAGMLDPITGPEDGELRWLRPLSHCPGRELIAQHLPHAPMQKLPPAL
jgi:hypothetical protein